MSAKNIAAVCVIPITVALVGCASIGGGNPKGPAPGGPIIVVVPESESLAKPWIQPGLKTYTVWSAGCPDSNKLVPRADYADTYKGIPSRLGNLLGAEKIVVTLNPEHRAYPFTFDDDGITFRASTFALEFRDARSLVVKLEALYKVPTWTIAPPTENLKPKKVPPLHNFSSSVFGHIAKVTVTDASGHTADIELIDLKDIKILYAKDDVLPDGVCK